MILGVVGIVIIVAARWLKRKEKPRYIYIKLPCVHKYVLLVMYSICRKVLSTLKQLSCEKRCGLQKLGQKVAKSKMAVIINFNSVKY